jgi:hypothetical protein
MYGLVEWDTTVALRPCGRRDMALSGALLCALCRSVFGREYCSVAGSDSERRSDSRGSASGRNTKRGNACEYLRRSRAILDVQP